MRLISFLGTGNYRETTYSFETRTCRTRYVSKALASITQPKEIYLIATPEAWTQHGSELTLELLKSGYPCPVQVPIPNGGKPDQLWEVFGTIVDAIRTSTCPIMVDITHGFRMQPFFAAACIQYVQAVVCNAPTISVVYGEFRDTDNESPIWELTPFLEVLSWSRNLMLFLRTGQADDIVDPTKAIGRELRKQWAATDRSNPQPGLDNLGKALEAFSDDFTTIRTGSLLTGKHPSTQKLEIAIERTKDEVAQHLPALALVLDQVEAMIEPLRTNGSRLSSRIGQQALIALARLYLKLGRYSEAISILREGWSTLNAPKSCDQPGTDEFVDDERKKWDAHWAYREGHPDPTTEVRNDIQHAGFRKKPNTKKWFEEQLTNLLNQWQTAIDSMAARHPE